MKDQILVLNIRQNTCKTDVEIVSEHNHTKSPIEKCTIAKTLTEFKQAIRHKPKYVRIIDEEGDFNVNGIKVNCDCPNCLLAAFVGDNPNYYYKDISY